MYRRARSSVVFVERAPFSVVICAESFRVSECGRRSFLYLPERHTADLLLCTAGCVTLAVFDALELGKPPIATPSASARFSKSGRYSSGRLFRRRATWKTNYQWEWRRDIGRGESKASRTRGNPSRRTPEGVRGARGCTTGSEWTHRRLSTTERAASSHLGSIRPQSEDRQAHSP
jgi:hypothetical protein